MLSNISKVILEKPVSRQSILLFNITLPTRHNPCPLTGKILYICIWIELHLINTEGYS